VGECEGFRKYRPIKQFKDPILILKIEYLKKEAHKFKKNHPS
jgi:hypothetical protein